MPSKPKSRKPGARSVPAVAKAAAVKTTPKPVTPVAVKAKPAPVVKAPLAKTAPMAKAAPAAKTPPKTEWPVAKASVAKPSVVETPVVEQVETREAAPVVEAVMLPVATPIAPTPIAPQPIAKSEIETPTPHILAAADILPVVATLKTKGDTIMTDVLETAKTYAEEAKTRIQGAMSEMSEKAKVAMEKSSKAFEEMGEITKGNLEAVVESSKIAAKGVESISQGAADFGRKHFEKTSATMKSFAAVKSPAEFFQLQSELMSSFMDSVASESAKSSETMLKLVSDISAPISNRVSIVTEKFKSLAA